MTITAKFGNHNTTVKAGRKIEYIVIHYTAGVTSRSGSASNTAAWYGNPSCKCSSDFTVDDTAVIQYNEDIENRYTWHCGGTFYSNKGGSMYRKCSNANSIGIEICSTNSTGKMQAANDKSYSFTAAAVSNAAALVKLLMNKYKIPAERVIRHYDVTGKPCPGIIGWNAESGSEAAWNAFKADISGNKSPAMYYVQVGAFSDKSKAEKFLNDVKNKYSGAFIKAISYFYYVQVGAFTSRTNAEKYLSEVRKDYPDAFIKQP